MGKVYSKLAIKGKLRCDGPAASMGEHGGVAGPAREWPMGDWGRWAGM